VSLQINLAHAEAAVKYAEQFLRGRASNRPEDILHTLQQNLREDYDNDKEAVLWALADPNNVSNKSREIYMQRVSDINDAREKRRQQGKRLDSAAIIADGIGNCFEHAVLACKYLKDKGVPSYMVETDEDVNHVFVVIGVGNGLAGTTLKVSPNTPPGPPLSTGDGVVCDPWYHEWFGIQQWWPTKMHRILLTTWKYKNEPLPSQVPLTFTLGSAVT
jgi:hypothetical protein